MHIARVPKELIQPETPISSNSVRNPIGHVPKECKEYTNSIERTRVHVSEDTNEDNSHLNLYLTMSLILGIYRGYRGKISHFRIVRKPQSEIFINFHRKHVY